MYMYICIYMYIYTLLSIYKYPRIRNAMQLHTTPVHILNIPL